MCGIVGLLLKKPEQRASLGRMAQPMFTCMAERGPDSGGLAVFGEPVPPGQRRFNLFLPGCRKGHSCPADWASLLRAFRDAFPGRGGQDARLEPLDNHAV